MFRRKEEFDIICQFQTISTFCLYNNQVLSNSSNAQLHKAKSKLVSFWTDANSQSQNVEIGKFCQIAFCKKNL